MIRQNFCSGLMVAARRRSLIESREVIIKILKKSSRIKAATLRAHLYTPTDTE